MRSRLHEMCEFLVLDGADYRELPTNGGVDDLMTLWKMAQEDADRRRPRRPPGARAAGEPASATASADLKWPGGRAELSH